MEKIRSLTEIEGESPISLTLGNFDGVHRGHQKLVQGMKVTAKHKVVVVSFYPHPRQVLNPQVASFLLFTQKQKELALKKMGVDYYLEISFSRDFSSLSPEDFFSQYIFPSKNLTHIFLGHDFRFGSHQSGNFEIAQSLCQERGVEAVQIPPYYENETLVSSTMIRDLVRAGKVREANSLMLFPFALESIVYRGQGRGKTIGFPTANIALPREQVLPRPGVYATETWFQGGKYMSLTNIGTNPTFITGNDLSVETYIFDFDRDIYGEPIEVVFLDFLREEKKFDSVNQLINQIETDCKNRRHLN